MRHVKLEYILALFISLIVFTGCTSVVSERLDPAKSTASRGMLNRPSVCNDGSVVAMSGRDVISMSIMQRDTRTLASFDKEHFAPLVSPANDMLVTFRYEAGTGYIDSSYLAGAVEPGHSNRLGNMIGVPVVFSATGSVLLLDTYTTDGIGQGVIMSPRVLNMTTGKLKMIGDQAVVDSTGTYILALDDNQLWVSRLDDPSNRVRVASGLNPVAISSDKRTAIVKNDEQTLQVLDLNSGGLRPLAKAGHTALFLRENREVAVVSGNKNTIHIVHMEDGRSRLLTDWQSYNTLPIVSNNGRFFVFERLEDELGLNRSILVFDHESNKLYQPY